MAVWLVALGNKSTPRATRGSGTVFTLGKFFDALSVHPFTDRLHPGGAESVRRVVEIVQRTKMARRGRAQADHHHRDKIPAARGKIPKRRLLGLETTQKGEIARLRAAYKMLLSKRRSLHLTQAYWYEWASQYDGNSPQSDVGYRLRRGNRPVPARGLHPEGGGGGGKKKGGGTAGARKGTDPGSCR